MYQYNYKFWLATAEQINDLFLQNVVYKKLKPTTNQKQAHEIFVNLYSRYRQIINNLSYLYDQTLQVQKRELIKTLLESSTKRLIELRNELKQIELSEFIYIDKILIQNKFVIEDIELLRPYYFPIKRTKVIQNLIDTDGKDYKRRMRKRNKIKAAKASPEHDEKLVSTEIKKLKENNLSKTDNDDKKLATNTRSSLKLQKSNSILEKDISSDIDDNDDDESQISQEDAIKSEKQKLINAVNLIKFHDRARRARKYFNNIKLHPKYFAPKPSSDTNFLYYYEFSHQPDQIMLIPVKRTNYDNNYYAPPRQVMGAFDFYVAPPETKEARAKSSNKELSREKSNISDAPEKSNVSERYEKPEKPDKLTQNILIENPNAEVEQEIEKKVNDEEVEIKMINLTESPDQDKDHQNVMTVNNEEIRDQEEENEPLETDISINDIFEIPLDHKIANNAARKIQNFWHKSKREKLKMQFKLKQQVLYGMLQDNKFRSVLGGERNSNIEQKKLQKFNEEQQRSKKPWYDEEFKKVCEDEKARIIKVKGPWIMEDITDHIRSWFKEFYDHAGDFDRFPEEWEGGTILLLKGETKTVFEYISEKRAKKLAKGKKKKEKKKPDKSAKTKKKKETGEVDYKFDENEHENYTSLREIMKAYKRDWVNINEANNVNEEPYMEWIRLDKYAEIHQELRLIVDNLMRIEFELLRKALAKDNKKKYKPQKKKKQKKGKKGKKKQPKDLLANRSTESLFCELSDMGIIKKYSRRNFKEYIGDYNFNAYEMKNIFQIDPKPSRLEVKDLIREYLLGMGPLEIPKPKTLCLMGPSGSGKHLLADIIASELDAVVFYLTPEIILQYESNMPYFMNLIGKLANILQPTIIQLDQVHQVYRKKRPNIKNFPKLFPKNILKLIKITDKVLVLGLTNSPWESKFGKMKKCFEKFILLPKNDYATTYQLWEKNFLSINNEKLMGNFDYSALTKTTCNYNAEDINANFKTTLNIRRRMNLPLKPLKQIEFVEGFVENVSAPPKFPITDVEYQKYVKFYVKTSKFEKMKKAAIRRNVNIKKK